MFAPETQKLVEQLIKVEYQNACEKFGDKYNSLHEGYAVLLEEVEEVEREMSFLKRWLENCWESIKSENKYYQNECIEQLEICNTNAMKELAQVGAVLMKIKNTLEENA